MSSNVFRFLVSTLSFLSSFSGAVSQGTLHRRDYFYVGQTYAAQGNSSIAFGQIYVEHLTPEKITQPFPLLMIHGHGMTGTNFLNTPDGRPGWADYFTSKGYEVYIIDQPSRGRSAWQKDIDGVQSAFDTFTIESHFTATQLHNLWPQASLHTKWPGNGSVGDPVFDAFYASTMPSLDSDEETAMKIRAAGSKLLDRIGPVVLLTHSQSGQHGWVLGDARPSSIRAIVALEPIGPPFINAVFPPIAAARQFGLTDIAVSYSPPVTSPEDIARIAVSSSPTFTCFQQASPPRKLVNLAHIPVLIVTSESSYHSIYDGCTAEFLRQAGVSVKHVNLGDVGIHGNGHMMFMEKNGLQIAEEVVQRWISQTVHA
ncbi:putative alpha/beta hydrolase [Lyophyllum shimeji]|uniref:Alpha/beta hydrolase n=1 Tax=Lyophyllum shimeji TaxID=47721 RepID=A0A9P3PCT2_LYOSH|nr:putative alpha/beta hydrolase [Lyophyllum shimeji]